MNEIAWVKDVDDSWVCPFNNACRCEAPNCSGCGWNPLVAMRRSQEIYERIMSDGE